MRKIVTLIAAGTAALLAAPALHAADMPYTPPEYVPEVDYGPEGGFYLRGSVAGNMMWARDFNVPCGCGPTGPYQFEKAGYGYSFGAGVGYEFGDGLRADVTLDYLENRGLYGTISPPGSSTFGLRSTVALANVYYDFGLSGGGPSDGGLGAYVGAGLGFAHYEIADIGLAPDPTGTGITGAGALMAGVTYDMGQAVADLGYRALYMPQINNGNIVEPINIRDALIHELRGTVRYRFN